ncbi:hypothetical protein CDAR_579491 [Caerostris darwini]|uniref:Uncharacterized protein n=1 Tax=Caerostris darwini TaxID=1538125 RepID=A0AAV4V366_9ARAC|nr:hypothetical protein CDAR_579491 [Caerostris darwini]
MDFDIDVCDLDLFRHVSQAISEILTGYRKGVWEEMYRSERNSNPSRVATDDNESFVNAKRLRGLLSLPNFRCPSQSQR